MAFQKFKVDNMHPNALQQVKDVLNGVNPSLVKAGGKIPDVSGFTKTALDQIVSACEGRAMVTVPQTNFYMTDTQIAMVEAMLGGEYIDNIFPTLGTYDAETNKFTGLVVDVPIMEGMIPGVPAMIFTLPVALLDEYYDEETGISEFHYAGVSSSYIKYLQGCMLDATKYSELSADLYYGEADMSTFYATFGEFTNIEQFNVNVSATTSTMSLFSGYSTKTDYWVMPLLVGANEPVIAGIGQSVDGLPTVVTPVWTAETDGRYLVIFNNDENLVSLSNTLPNTQCLTACVTIDNNYLGRYLLRHAILCVNAASNIGDTLFTCYKHNDGVHGWAPVQIAVTAPTPSAE